MKNPYLMFYEQKTNQLHKDLLPGLKQEDYPHLILHDAYYHLKANILIGRLDHKRTFGFLRQELDDVYIEQTELSDAMHDDIVLVMDGARPRIIEILKRALRVVIATVKKGKGGLYFVADTYLDRQLEVRKTDGLVTGHVVYLEVIEIKTSVIITEVKKIIGHTNDPDIETLKIVNAYDWPQSFSEEVMKSLDDIKMNMEDEMINRLDLSNELIITIDGEDAKDLDDAIHLRLVDDQYHLGVHIADVSHYVRENSPVDEEAYKRSTSSYLADRVIPMLPHLLSNDLCSLNPDEIKLTLSCLMTLDLDGKVIAHDIQKSFIKSKRRMNYDEVNAFLKKNKSLNNRDIETMLIHMNELSQKLKLMRNKRGEIEFISSELGFKVDSKGRVLNVYERTSDDAEQLIESFMLIANET
ncbi:MAG: RNB domain-containing ribonuclease, partial [Acholeplasmataceae bacterium]|nr:RNB domain-containing ribonuclease [Acholeplasmataceae bacterium]